MSSGGSAFSFFRLLDGIIESVDFTPVTEYRQLYEFIKKKRGVGPHLVIDSADLLENSEPVMKAFCQHVGVNFTPDMLQWSSGHVDHFARWPVSLFIIHPESS